VRVKGVGLVDRATGVCMPSPWRVSIRGGVPFARKLFEYQGGLDNVGGPYTLLANVRGQ